MARQTSGTVIRDCFPGEEVTDLLLNFFEGSHEEIMGREQKEEVLWVMLCKAVRGGGRGAWKTCKALYTWSMWMMILWRRVLCWINVCEHSMHARLEYWIWSQNCRNTLLWYECSTSESTLWKTNEMLLWLVGMNYVKIRTHC